MFFKKIIKCIFYSLLLIIIISLIIFISLVNVFRLDIKSFKFSNNHKIIRRPQDIFSSHKVFIESHCGVNREIFENTLESFSKAIEYNIESMETDVWLTKDKVLVLIHGSLEGKIDKVLNYTGNIKDLSWDEISKLRTIKDNLTVPRLIDAFELAKNKIFINLEIKDPRINLVFPEIIKLIEEYDFFDQIALSSFYHQYYKKIEEYNKKNNKNLVFGFAYKRNRKNNKFDYSKKGNTLNIHWKDVTKEVCENAHKNGMGVLAWFGMDEEETIENYKLIIENGVDIICSNYPLNAKNYRDSLYKI